MANQHRITLSLPPGVVRRLDRAAAGARRSRSNAASLLLDSALAGKQRLAELGRLAAQAANAPDEAAETAKQAAADHLGAHAGLCGLERTAIEPDNETSPESQHAE